MIFDINMRARELEHRVQDLEEYIDYMEDVKEQLEKNGKVDKIDLEECQFIYEEIDSDDMTVMNRIWKTYNKYKKEGKVYNVWDEIDQMLREGKKINAIKRYRELFDTGLKESKDAIENRYMKLT